MQTHTRVIYLYADDNKKYGMHTLKLLLGLAPLDERKFSGCSPHHKNVHCTRGLMNEMPRRITAPSALLRARRRFPRTGP